MTNKWQAMMNHKVTKEPKSPPPPPPPSSDELIEDCVTLSRQFCMQQQDLATPGLVQAYRFFTTFK